MTQNITTEEMKDMLPALCDLARKAGALELRYYNSGTDIQQKSDGSPVTIADQEAEKIILDGLVKLTPNIPIIAEEAMAAGIMPDISGGLYWLVDPLDGTKEFIKGTGEFTVNIALMQDFKPILGVIYTPVVDELYTGYGKNTATMCIKGGAEQKISVRTEPDNGLTVITSRSHTNMTALSDFLDGKTIAETNFRGSSLKFCEIAAGRADIYPRLAPTCEWDIAAGHAILHAAGGKLTHIDGSDFTYGKADVKFLNPFFIARAA